jgi:hypothetical protein
MAARGHSTERAKNRALELQYLISTDCKRIILALV